MSKWLNILVYGNAGFGKTTLLASAADVPQMRDIMFLDVEGGDMVVEDNPRIKHPEFIFRNRVRVGSFRQIAAIHDWLKGHCQFRDKQDSASEKILTEAEARMRQLSPQEITEGPQRFRTVVLDSMTEANAYSIYELIGVTEAKVLSGDADEIEVAQWDEFRKNNQKMQMLTRAFRDLPMNFLASALAQYVQDERKAFHWVPASTGQLTRQLPGFFDIVGYMYIMQSGEKREHRLYTNPDAIQGIRYTAKNRRAAFRHDFFMDPTMSTIMEGIKLLKAETASPQAQSTNP